MVDLSSILSFPTQIHDFNYEHSEFHFSCYTVDSHLVSTISKCVFMSYVLKSARSLRIANIPLLKKITKSDR